MKFLKLKFDCSINFVTFSSHSCWQITDAAWEGFMSREQSTMVHKQRFIRQVLIFVFANIKITNIPQLLPRSFPLSMPDQKTHTGNLSQILQGANRVKLDAHTALTKAILNDHCIKQHSIKEESYTKVMLYKTIQTPTRTRKNQ